MVLGPFGDQPFLARGDLGALAPPGPSLVLTPAVGCVNTRDDERGGDRVAVGTVAERDRLSGAGSEAGDQLTDGLGGTVRCCGFGGGVTVVMSVGDSVSEVDLERA